jgi:gliding motility-associated-like protein
MKKNRLNNLVRSIIIVLGIVASTNSNSLSQCVVATVQDVTCYGDSNGSVTITINNPGTAYNFSIFGAFGPKSFNNSPSNTHTFTNLPAEAGLIVIGQYKVGAVFVNCPPILTAINQPPKLIFSGSSTNVSCNGGSNGTASLSPSGGTPPYSYSWSNGPTSQNVTGLSAGSYTATITDANGCVEDTSFIISQPPPISIPGNVTDVTCNGGTNGTINITPSGGTTPYSFSWSNGATTEDLTGLAAGSYTVTITDANGCPPANATFTVLQPAPLVIPGSVTNVTCNGGTNGAVNITPAGGTPPYSFSWSNGATSEDISSLPAGSYTVTIIDANSCPPTVATFTVTEPTLIVIPGTVTNVTCNAGSDGAVDITPSGGIPPYSFSWSNGATTEDISGLVAGSYTITITDANSCPMIATFTVIQPAPIVIPGTVTNVTCNGGTNGTVNITPSGGTLPYSFSWSNGATTEDLTGLAAGSYTVTITDANSCPPTNATFTVTEPAPLTIPGIVNDVTCNTGTNGTINITPSGGTLPYSFSWSNGATTEDLTGLAAGSYTVTITDANSCPPTNATFTVTEPAPLTIPGIVTDVTCNTGSNGAIDITPSGGTLPYSFSWSNGATTEDISGLTAGSYTITITDANSCPPTNATFTVTEPAPILIPGVVTNVTCNAGSNGAINITPSGGTLPYSFSWSNGATTEDISGLTAGSYTITITDANSCPPTNATFTVIEPAPLLIPGVVTNVTCNGGTNGTVNITPSGGTLPYSFSWSNGATTEDLTGLAAGSYTVTITDANSCPPTNATFTVIEPAPILIPGTVTDITCNGQNDGAVDITPSGGTAPYSISWSNGATTEDISALPGGSYTVTITDANSCPPQTATFTVIEPPLVTGTAIATPALLCTGDPTVITANFDAPFIPDVNGYSFDGGNTFQAGNTFNINSVNSDTTVIVMLRDINGCRSNAIPVNITLKTIPATVSVTPVTCFGANDGVAVINITAGNTGFSFAIDGGSFQAGNTFSGLTPGSHIITARDDANGCRYNFPFTITEPATLTLGIASTQNVNPCAGSSSNGMIAVTSSGGTPLKQFTISVLNITQTDSTFNNLPAGTYTITVTDINNCTANATTTLTTPPPVDITGITTLQKIDNICNGKKEGRIELDTSSIQGGVEPYTYTLGGVVQAYPDFNLLFAGNDTILITDANGCMFNYPFNIAEPSPIQFFTTSVPETCGNADGSVSITNPTGGVGGYTFSLGGVVYGASQTFNNLASGTYQVFVQDANNCIVGQPATVSPKPLPIPYIHITPPLCFGELNGSVVIDSVQGGIPPFTYSIDSGGTFRAQPRFDSLGANVYTMQIQDQICTYQIGTFYIFNNTLNQYDTISSNIVLNTTTGLPDTLPGTFVIPEPLPITGLTYTINTNKDFPVGIIGIYSVMGGTSPYQYSLDDSTYSNFMLPDSTVIGGLGKGNYTVYIMDSNGCKTSMSVYVGIQFFIPNLITPNGDKFNDVFEIVGLPINSELRVYNRWSERVYQNKNYDNSWDGGQLPDGIYYFDLTLSEGSFYKGWVEIMSNRNP